MWDLDVWVRALRASCLLFLGGAVLSDLGAFGCSQGCPSPRFLGGIFYLISCLVLHGSVRPLCAAVGNTGRGWASMCSGVTLVSAH
jgi:hypothetical protein